MADIEKRVEAMEGLVGEIITKLEEQNEKIGKLERTVVKKNVGLFGGKRERAAIKDTKTNKVYVSKSACAKSVAPEFNLEQTDHFAWYKITSQAPERFIEASPEEKATAEAEEKAAMEAWVAQQNKEAAEKVAAEAKAKAAEAKK